MKGKKSFILYCDVIHNFKELTNEEAGVLIKHILAYVNDENPILTDRLLKIAFEPIRQQLKRDLEKWNGFIERQTEYGKKGGRPKKPNPLQNNPTLLEKTDGLKKNPTNVTVNVNDNVNVSEEEKKILTPSKNYFENQLKNSFTWLEQNCRTFRIDMPKCNTFLEQFISEQKAADNFDHRDFADLKKHFSNWLKIQLEKQKKNNSTDKTHKISEALPRA